MWSSGPARLRESARLSRGSSYWRPIIKQLVHGDAYLRDFFDHAPDLWFIKRWVVPREAEPGDQILAVRGAMHPIVIRPLAEPKCVEFIGRADFGVGHEHRSLGEALERCSQQLLPYRQRTRDRSRIEQRPHPRSRSRVPYAQEYISTRERERLAGYRHRATEEFRVLRFFYDLVTAAMKADAQNGSIFEDITIV